MASATLPELIALAKKEPGKITIAATGVGRLTHLTGLVIAGPRRHISCFRFPITRGPAAALADVASGRVSMIIEGYSGILGAVNAGQVKLIAVARPRTPAGISGPAFGLRNNPRLFGDRLAGPGRADRHAGADRKKVSVDLAEVVGRSGIQKDLANIGSYSRAMTPDEALAFVDKEQATWLPVVAKLAKP